MSSFHLPLTVNILDREYSVQWQTNNDMTGCAATVNIGRKFADDQAAEDFGFYEIGGISDVTTYCVTPAGDVVMTVRP